MVDHGINTWCLELGSLGSNSVSLWAPWPWAMLTFPSSKMGAVVASKSKVHFTLAPYWPFSSFPNALARASVSFLILSYLHVLPSSPLLAWQTPYAWWPPSPPPHPSLLWQTWSSLAAARDRESSYEGVMAHHSLQDNEISLLLALILSLCSGAIIIAWELVWDAEFQTYPRPSESEYKC